MDPLVAASTFSTIVALIGQFRSERSGAAQADVNEFMTWLATTQHEELKRMLEMNTKATIGIKALLHEDREAILQKLQSLDNALSSFASGIHGFAEIAEAIKPEAVLSKQALSILQQLEESGGSKFLEVKYLGGMELVIMDGDTQGIEIEEPRFVEDDLRVLVELGLLRHDFNSQGHNVFIYTRAGAALVQSIINNS